MNAPYDAVVLSHHRRKLASFDNAMRIATRMAEEEGKDQLIIETGDASQPHRVILAEEILPGARWCGLRIHTVRAQVSAAA